MTGLVGPVLVAAAAMVLVAGGHSVRPLRRLSAATAAAQPSRRPSGFAASAGARRALAVAVGLCLAVVVGGLAGVLVGSTAAVGVDRALARRPDRAGQRDQEAAERDLPLALDLLACALRAGAPPALAAVAVAGAVGGPVGAALAEVARGTALGSPPDLAWQPLGRFAGAGPATRMLARAAASGTRLAGELGRSADDLRARRAAANDARLRRAGVLVVLPLGLCFLPAFVCVGVVPIVIGIAGTVLR